MKGPGGTGDLRENPPISGIVQHVSHLRKPGSSAGDCTRFALVGGEQANRLAKTVPNCQSHKHGDFTAVSKQEYALQQVHQLALAVLYRKKLMSTDGERGSAAGCDPDMMDLASRSAMFALSAETIRSTSCGNPGDIARSSFPADDACRASLMDQCLHPDRMGQRWNARVGETGVPQENPLASGIVQQDSHMRESGSKPDGDRTQIAVVGGECASHCVTAALFLT
ncbi:hypothetical protein PR048_017282 [Dryococelus australis]|uniref:Uncharacterized protein n=1 Tax=Dryococelus australis TaxID=614101 RepID=A0ABQ9H979_9NEOP|nr:hypothetical protein PR048_017282 [Dryococelus australis]